MAKIDTTETTRNALLEAVARVLAPLARMLLRRGVGYEAFLVVAKDTFIRAARDDFRIPGRKPSASRIAVLTGMNRKDVARFLATENRKAPERASIGRAARVVAGWRNDATFQTRGKRPQSLHFEGAKPSFTDLVRRYGADVPPRAILDELLRVGAVERLRDGRVKLLAQAYVSRESDPSTYAILGAHASDLLRTIEHNVEKPTETAFLQRRVNYDNLPESEMPRLRSLATGAAVAVLEKIDRAVSRFDRDVNPSVRGQGRKRLALGVYYYEEDFDEGEPQ